MLQNNAGCLEDVSKGVAYGHAADNSMLGLWARVTLSQGMYHRAYLVQERSQLAPPATACSSPEQPLQIQRQPCHCHRLGAATALLLRMCSWRTQHLLQCIAPTCVQWPAFCMPGVASRFSKGLGFFPSLVLLLGCASQACSANPVASTLSTSATSPTQQKKHHCSSSIWGLWQPNRVQEWRHQVGTHPNCNSPKR